MAYDDDPDSDDEDRDDLDPDTREAVDMINNVYDHNIDQIEREIGHVVLYNVGRFMERARPLPQRQRLAALYVVLTKVSVALRDVGAACEHLRGEPLT